MSTARRAHQPVGSTAWIAAEKENVMHLVDQEMEEIEFPVRHEIEWLNEHMAEIFSRNQLKLTEIFKTPNKLRGKTPRTVRNHNVDEIRVPLSDLLSSNHHMKSSPTPDTVFEQEMANFTQHVGGVTPSAVSNIDQKSNPLPAYNTDSGYHGMSDDDVMLQKPHIVSDSATQPLEDDTKRDEQIGYHGMSDDDVVLQEPHIVSDSATQPLQDNTKRDEQIGYHGMSDDDVMHQEPHIVSDSATQPPQDDSKRNEKIGTSPSTDGRITEESFHSAQENFRRGDTVEPMILDSSSESNPDEQTPRPVLKDLKSAENPPISPERLPQQGHPVLENKDKDTVIENQFEDIGSPSDGSTPDRPLIRKSSLTFASLPAREPLVTKKSLGGSRISRTSHVDLIKLNSVGRTSYFGGQAGGPRTTRLYVDETDQQTLETDRALDGKKNVFDSDTDEDTRATKLHHKSSTQRLQEKISQLGKFQSSRPTKSIPSVPTLAASQVAYPDLSNIKLETLNGDSRVTTTHEPVIGNEVESIKPLGSPSRETIPKSPATGPKEQTHPIDDLENEKSRKAEQMNNPVGHHSPITKVPHSSEPSHEQSTTGIVAPLSPQRPNVRSTPQKKTAPFPAATIESTTPSTSPKRYDGALSLSKSKLQSLMKTAKGLFTSSAGVSAAAKMEALSPSVSQSHPNVHSNLSNLHGSQGLHQDNQSSPQTQEGERGKRKEREDKDSQIKEERPEIKEQGRSKVPAPKILETPSFERETVSSVTSARISPKKANPPPKQTPRGVDPHNEAPPKFVIPPIPPHQPPPPKPTDRRPVKPTREAAKKPKPQPVSIRVGSTLSRPMQLSSSTASLSSSVQDSGSALVAASATVPPKKPTLTKKASNSSLQTSSSTSSFRSAAPQSQRKAQVATDKKKLEERESRRREEQKREQERKKVVAQQQQEEARRQELKNRAEAERRERERLAMDDPKKAAQRQAIEQRRLENARKLERQASQQPSPAHEMMEKPGSQRTDLGSAQPPSRLGSVQPFSRSINQPPPNSAKPAKRPLEEEPTVYPTLPTSSSTYQPVDNKRRKTEDEHNPPPVRPTMAPPIRQSNIRKEAIKPQTFAHGFVPAPPPATHHQTAPALHKNPPTATHNVQQTPAGPPHRTAHPMDMAKYTSGKIPFADGSNQVRETTYHKTPNQNSQRVAAKPSPQYPNGEHVYLPEIPTDSEDEDSEAEILPVPRWAQPKELEALLREQEGLETESIFGPIAPFSLEETFKADKKVKKYRDRTSSANWGGPDGLTHEEIRKDIAERQRLRVNGGWTFPPS